MRSDRDSRLFELLWWVGYCGDFPVSLVGRIGGHEDWNRHVMYGACRKGYLEIYRAEKKGRVVKSLRITEAGLDFVGNCDSDKYNLILARQELDARGHGNLDKVLRSHALAHGLVMANAIGAVTLPAEKPSLKINTVGNYAAHDPDATYYYTAWELREALRERSPNTSPKTARILGVLIREGTLYFLYYTGLTRMYLRQNTEGSVKSSICTLLTARGFHYDTTSMVVIGHGFEAAKKIARQGINSSSKYLCVTTSFNNFYYVTDNMEGERVLKSIVDPVTRKATNDRILSGYRVPEQPTRSYDALTPDTAQPVVLSYQFDLLELLLLNTDPFGYPKEPVLLCYDYQANAIQSIVGPTVEVRIINGGQYETKTTDCGRH